MGNYNWQAQLWAQKAREQGYPEEYIESVVGKQDTYTGPTIGPARPDYVRGKTISAKEKKKQEETQKAIAETKRAITRDLAVGMGTNDPQAQEAVAGVNSFLYNPSTALIGLNPAAGVGSMIGGYAGSELLGDYMAGEYGEAGRRFGTTLGGLAGGIVGGSVGGLLGTKAPVVTQAKKSYSKPEVTTMSMDNSIATGDPQAVIQKLPGFQLKSFIKGSPIERFVQHNGMISVRTIEQYMSNPKRPPLDRTIIKYLLDNKFKGKTHVNYNEFRRAIQKLLVRSTGRQFTTDPAYFNSAFIYQPATLKLKSGNVQVPIQRNPFIDGVMEYVDSPEYSFFDKDYKFMHRWLEGEGVTDTQSFDYILSREDPSLMYSTKQLTGFINRNRSNLTKSIKRKDRAKLAAAAIGFERAKNVYKKVSNEIQKYQRVHGKRMNDPNTAQLFNELDAANNVIQSYYESAMDYDPTRLILLRHLAKNFDQITLQRLLNMASRNKKQKLRIPTAATYDPSTKRPVLVKSRSTPSRYVVRDPLRYAYTPEYQYNSERLVNLFKQLYKGHKVQKVYDDEGNTWYEFEVPENFLEMEHIYKEGGKL